MNRSDRLRFVAALGICLIAGDGAGRIPAAQSAAHGGARRLRRVRPGCEGHARSDRGLAQRRQVLSRAAEVAAGPRLHRNVGAGNRPRRLRPRAGRAVRRTGAHHALRARRQRGRHSLAEYVRQSRRRHAGNDRRAALAAGSVVAVTPIVAESRPQVVISTAPFLGDVANLAAQFDAVASKPAHGYQLDSSRAFFIEGKAFPQNTILRVSQTWATDSPDTIDNAPDAAQHRSQNDLQLHSGAEGRLHAAHRRSARRIFRAAAGRLPARRAIRRETCTISAAGTSSRRTRAGRRTRRTR